MSRLRLLSLAAMAALLAGAILLRPGSEPGAEDTAAPVARQVVATAPAAAPPPRGTEMTEHWVAAILERPLFSPGRRPPSPAPAAAAPAPPPAYVAPPPRLSGVLIGPHGRSAIFAGEDGGKSVSVTEGGRIGAFIVQAIEAGQVMLHGPDGPRILRPSFAEAAADGSAEAPEVQPSAVASRRPRAGGANGTGRPRRSDRQRLRPAGPAGARHPRPPRPAARAGARPLRPVIP